MRIGEIAVVGPDRSSIDAFIRMASDEIDIENQTLTFGRFSINPQLLLHLYGMQYESDDLRPAWDLLSRRLMGYVFVFDWGDSANFSQFRPAIDALTTRYRSPFVVAAAVKKPPDTIPEKLFDLPLNVSEQTRFTFFQLDEPESVRHVLLILVNTLIDKLSA
jgi:hypothetical protein